MENDFVGDVKFLENGDIVTACSDGVVRIWTVNNDKIADLSELESFASQLSHYKISRKKVGGLKLEDLPGLEALQLPGTSDGQTKVVREGDNGVAYAWNLREQKWDKVCNVMEQMLRLLHDEDVNFINADGRTMNKLLLENWSKSSLLHQMNDLATRRKLEDLIIGPVLTFTTEAMLVHVNKVLQVAGSKLLFGGDIIKTLKDNGDEYTWGNVTVKLAESYGFCWGVERAFQIAYEARKQFPKEMIWITNKIIHNPTVNKAMC